MDPFLKTPSSSDFKQKHLCVNDPFALDCPPYACCPSPDTWVEMT